MKNKLFLVLFTLLTIQSLAQQKSSAIGNKEPKLFRQPDLEKFYGTWVYEKNGVYFSILLEKYIFINSADHDNSMELLRGTHIYKKNGEIIDKKPQRDILTSINVGAVLRNNSNLISFRFNEYNRRVSSSGTMEYVGGHKPYLLWKLNLPESRNMVILAGEEDKKNLEYIVPTNTVLYKVK